MKTLPFRSLITTAIAIQLLLLIFPFIELGLSMEALGKALRMTGRFSLLFYSLVLFNAVGIVNLFQEKQVWLTFWAIHFIHLVLILNFLYLSELPIIPTRLAGGMIAYSITFIYPFLLYRNVKPHKALRHFAYMFVWLVFFMTYLPRVQGKLPNAGGTMTEYITAISFTVAIGLVYVLASFRRTKTKVQKEANVLSN